jgi:hypothetical protein
MRFGKYVSIVDDITSTKRLDSVEWDKVVKLPKIPLHDLNENNVTNIGLLIFDRFDKMYSILGRKNIPTVDKRKVLIHLGI